MKKKSPRTEFDAINSNRRISAISAIYSRSQNGHTLVLLLVIILVLLLARAHASFRCEVILV